MNLGFAIALSMPIGILLLLALIGFIGLLMDAIKHKSYEEGLGGAFVTAVGMIACMIAVWVGHADWQSEYDAGYNTLVQKIVSMDRDQSVEGSFALGCGGISTKPTYYYYYEVSENVYTLGQVVAEDKHPVYIIETDEVEPSVYRCKAEKTDPTNYYHNIYVPYNTVIKAFSA